MKWRGILFPGRGLRPNASSGGSDCPKWSMGRASIGYRVLLAFLLNLTTSPALGIAQVSSNPRAFSPTVQVGGSLLLVDIEDPITDAGFALRGGILTPAVEVTALVEGWRNLKDVRIVTTLVEVSYSLTGYTRVSPLLVMAAGYTWQDYGGRSQFYSTPDGRAAAGGLGVRTFIGDAILFRIDGLLRTDAGGYNAGARLLLGWAPALVGREGRHSWSGAGAVVYWMVPLSGPWRFTEPGFGVRVSRAIDARWFGGMELGIFHWQIPSSRETNPGEPRPYIWDTRAVVMLPELERRLVGIGPLQLRGGPAVVMMGEGPGRGASLGAHLGAMIEAPSPVPLNLTIRWLWMQNDNHGDVGFTDRNQQGLLIAGEIGF